MRIAHSRELAEGCWVVAGKFETQLKAEDLQRLAEYLAPPKASFGKLPV
jgi:hypothetical protein